MDKNKENIEKKENKIKRRIKPKKGKNLKSWLIWLAALTLLTAFIWVSLQSYRQLVRKDRLEEVEQLLVPFDPNLKVEVMEKINQTQEYRLEDVADYLRVEPVRDQVEEEVEEEVDEEIDEEVEVLEDIEIEEFFDSQPSEATPAGENDE